MVEIDFNECLNFIEFPSFNSNLIIISTQGNTILVRIKNLMKPFFDKVYWIVLFNVKVYDLAKKSTAQTIQSKSLNAAFVNIACSDIDPVLLTNTSDGCLHLYEYNKTSEFRFVKKIDLDDMYNSYLSQHLQSMFVLECYFIFKC
jgi:hypothetical protein